MLAHLQQSIETYSRNEQDLEAIVQAANAFAPQADPNTVIKLLGEYDGIVAFARTFYEVQPRTGGIQGLVMGLLENLATMLEGNLNRRTTEEIQVRNHIEAIDELMRRMG